MLQAINATGYSKPTYWCGPGAVATHTGLPLVAATEMLTRISGGTYDELDGVWSEDVILALHEQGKTCRPIDIIARYPSLTHGPQLKTFLADRTPVEQMSPLLIEVSGHFISAHMSYLVDNWVMKPTHMNDFPMKGRLVKRAWIVT